MKSASSTLNREQQLREMNEALLLSSLHQHELTEQAQQAESLIQCQKESLELLVKGEPIERVLDFLARSMESQSLGRFLVAIHLMEPDGYHFGYVAAPSLPARYAQTTKGMDARLELGCCSSAVMSHAPTVVRDFAIETRWPAFTAEVASLGLRGCFTTPILTPNEKVLGTFVIYYREPGDPSPHDRQLVDIVTGTVALAIERKQAEESQARLAAIVESSEDAIISKDLDGTITTWNSGAQHLFGYTAAEAVGKPVTMLIPEDHLDEEPKILGRFKRGEVVEHYETVRRRKDGTLLDISLTISPLRDPAGRIIGASKVARDITRRKRADEELRRSAELLTFLIDRSPSGFYIVDSNFRISHINSDSQARAFRNVVPAIGRRLDEAMRILWPEPLATEIIGIFSHTLDTGEPYRSPGLVSPRNDLDTVETYEWQLDRITMPDGTHGVVCYYYDTTRLRETELALRESEERFRMLADNMQQLAWTCDTNLGNVTWYNKRWLDYTGLSFEDMQGWGWKRVHHPDHVDRVVKSVERSRDTGEPWEDTFPLRGKDGQYRWFLSRGVPIRDEAGNIVRWFGTNTDVTEQRESQQEADEANRAKDMFLATLSHEIRTPLSAIVGWMQILQGGMEGGCSDAELSEGLDIIERNARTMVEMLDDVMDVSRIISGKVRLEVRPCELSAVIRAGIDVVRPAASAKNIAISEELDPAASAASCDAARIQQVVWNLLSNAVKFTPRGGKVHVTLAHERSDVRIEVSDSGPGIDPELLPYVFDRFRQADSSTRRRFGGLGLGLSIVKHLVELHGGTVQAESEGEGRGATFTVLLPVSAVRMDEGGDDPDADESEQPARTELPLVRLDALRVLVVDDEPDARRLLVKVLEQAGAVVTAAASAAEAIEALAEANPEILVSDLGMPDQDGFDLIRQIRAHGRHAKDLPAVALTAFVHKNDGRQALLAGFQVHVPKPADPHDLTAVIASLAGRTGPAA